jgi:predicted phosphodiesterase
MIFLVVADIHGNLDAFEAVLGAESGSFDALLFLGDATGYGPDPEATVSLLRSLASSISTSVFFAGNHDGALFGRVDPEWFNPRLRGSFDRTRALLSRESIDWLADRKPCATPLPGILACHGSPRDPYAEYLWGGPETLASLDGLAATGLSLCFVGHTHEAAFFARDAKPAGRALRSPRPAPEFGLATGPRSSIQGASASRAPSLGTRSRVPSVIRPITRSGTRPKGSSSFARSSTIDGR